jgi:hypothetical protein
VSAVTSTTVPPPVAITITPVTAAFHPVPVVPVPVVPVSIVVLAKRQTPETENNQQAENYKAL